MTLAYDGIIYLASFTWSIKVSNGYTEYNHLILSTIDSHKVMQPSIYTVSLSSSRRFIIFHRWLQLLTLLMLLIIYLVLFTWSLIVSHDVLNKIIYILPLSWTNFTIVRYLLAWSNTCLSAMILIDYFEIFDMKSKISDRYESVGNTDCLLVYDELKWVKMGSLRECNW